MAPAISSCLICCHSFLAHLAAFSAFSACIIDSRRLVEHSVWTTCPRWVIAFLGRVEMQFGSGLLGDFLLRLGGMDWNWCQWMSCHGGNVMMWFELVLFFWSHLLTVPNSTMSQRTSQITLFLCPVEGCDTRFKSTCGWTQHIFALHPNFGINESTAKSWSDDANWDPSPSSHTSQLLDQADKHWHMGQVINSDPPPILSGSDDFLQPPMTYSPHSSPPPFDVDDPLGLLPFSASQSSTAILSLWVIPT